MEWTDSNDTGLLYCCAVLTRSPSNYCSWKARWLVFLLLLPPLPRWRAPKAMAQQVSRDFSFRFSALAFSSASRETGGKDENGSIDAHGPISTPLTTTFNAVHPSLVPSPVVLHLFDGKLVLDTFSSSHHCISFRPQQHFGLYHRLARHCPGTVTRPSTNFKQVLESVLTPLCTLCLDNRSTALPRKAWTLFSTNSTVLALSHPPIRRPSPRRLIMSSMPPSCRLTKCRRRRNRRHPRPRMKCTKAALPVLLLLPTLHAPRTTRSSSSFTAITTR
ncbi:uncharacterized protein BDZ83DRAFT_361539 [Colletotrichum acutatum]|uniref:Uncharacterized protein n=1 Tax=Glomerella acutata TaxID=27357 RepID=A0AAD8XGR4_GLOAC|nr:uncharacterized protein BDZ83DRAFT_361539 [Colletotrichum acutatum]KAK1724228.1 hypothetical protein BDZ83DRAFT_361539 [Colletotrichum acutatum]